MKDNKFTAEELIFRITERENTDEEWLQLDKDVSKFLKTDISPEIRRKFEPLGYAEMLSIICDGIRWEREQEKSNIKDKVEM